MTQTHRKPLQFAVCCLKIVFSQKNKNKIKGKMKKEKRKQKELSTNANYHHQNHQRRNHRHNYISAHINKTSSINNFEYLFS